MAGAGKLWNINQRVAWSADEQSPDFFWQQGAGVRENMQRRANIKELQTQLEVHRTRLADRTEKVAAFEDWIEALTVSRALGISCQDIATVQEQLEAETQRRDFHSVVVRGLEREIARREAGG